MSADPFGMRVQKGVAYLDEVYPGWRDKVSVEDLDMSANSKCVLTQASGVPAALLLDWYEWDEDSWQYDEYGPRPAPALDVREATIMGFWLSPGDRDGFLLTEAWVKELHK